LGEAGAIFCYRRHTEERAMKDEILVPLDGSTLAEAILPHAVMLARATASSLTLLRAVAQPITTVSAAMWMATYSMPDLEQWEAEGDAATGYLNQVAARLRDQGITVNVRAVMSAPAEGILDYATRSPDLRLIALATHGRTGVTRWLLGSVAEKVVQGADHPLLLERPTAAEAGPAVAPVKPYTKILVPLDGSALAEQALYSARSLADAMGAGLLLLTVLPSLDESALVEEAAAIRRHDAQQSDMVRAARTYLAGVARQLEEARVPVQTKIVYGHPAEAILRIAAQERADVIAMATHGRGGLQRLWLGSVTLKVVQRAETPVLVIRPRPHAGA
jgi:nucleotide-binding universal stress UspA family protein